MYLIELPVFKSGEVAQDMMVHFYPGGGGTLLMFGHMGAAEGF